MPRAGSARRPGSPSSARRRRRPSTTSGSTPSSVLAQSQMPRPRVQCCDGVVHVEPLQRRLLAGDDHVDVLPAAQAVVGHRQQRVGVRRQVDPDDVGLLVHHVVDEARVLVGEAVVVLPPDVRGEQVVQRGDRPPPRDAVGRLQPLGVLVEHRVDDVDERLVGDRRRHRDGDRAGAPVAESSSCNSTRRRSTIRHAGPCCPRRCAARARGWLNAEGARFMERYDPAGELAPRDRVARAIVREMERTGGRDVSWSIGMPAFVRARFPLISRSLPAGRARSGARSDPVGPAAHYVMGGVQTDIDGRTRSPASTRRARSRAQASTARIGWRATRSSRGSCSGRAPAVRCATIVRQLAGRIAEGRRVRQRAASQARNARLW